MRGSLKTTAAPAVATPVTSSPAVTRMNKHVVILGGGLAGLSCGYELQKAGKPFQMMIYPKTAHGVSDPQLALHLRAMTLDFTVKNLVR